MKLYENKNIKFIKNNLENIQKKGLIAKVQNLEPKLEEYNKVIKVIKNFIKEKKSNIWW